MYHRWNLMYTAGSALLVASIPDKPALNTNEDEEAGELAKMKKMPSGLSKPSESSHSELSEPAESTSAPARLPWRPPPHGGGHHTTESKVNVKAKSLVSRAPAVGSDAAIRLRIQGINEFIVRSTSVLAATMAGILLHGGGWRLVRALQHRTNAS